MCILPDARRFFAVCRTVALKSPCVWERISWHRVKTLAVVWTVVPRIFPRILSCQYFLAFIEALQPVVRDIPKHMLHSLAILVEVFLRLPTRYHFFHQTQNKLLDRDSVCRIFRKSRPTSFGKAAGACTLRCTRGTDRSFQFQEGKSFGRRLSFCGVYESSIEMFTSRQVPFPTGRARRRETIRQDSALLVVDAREHQGPHLRAVAVQNHDRFKREIQTVRHCPAERACLDLHSVQRYLS